MRRTCVSIITFFGLAVGGASACGGDSIDVGTVRDSGAVDTHGDAFDSASSDDVSPVDASTETSVDAPDEDADATSDAGDAGWDARATCSGATVDLSSDAHNCGRCARDCLGAACIGGLCQPVVLASGLDEPARLAVDGTNVYATVIGYTFGGSVIKVPIAGGPLVTLAERQSEPFAIALDATYVYWVNGWDKYEISKVATAGGATTVLATTDYGNNIAVDATHLYWTSSGDMTKKDAGSVVQMSLTTGAVTTLASGLDDPWAIAVDASFVYFRNAGSLSPPWDGSVVKVPIGGGSPTVLAASLDWSKGLAIDDANVYLGSYFTEEIVRVSKSAPFVATKLASSVDAAGPMTVDAVNAYFANATGGILSVPLVGGPATLLAAGLNVPDGLANDADWVYCAERGERGKANGRVVKIAK